MEDMFEDVATETVRDVPEEYTKPDYYARKTCNYLTSVLQDCFSCLSPAKIAIQRDILVKQLLAKTEDIPAFDNDKCPIIKEYLVRNSGGVLAGSFLLVAFGYLNV
eukprot:TRINITY_DN11694_c0_g1_i1.p1 TRINITY_DN11694_c0_g1~~TRINITY_DN11694_c0_g1_i1.p1  ORF type:complete len:106 (-),score=23.12 TRINITY_DN11694_c0_g1_i1:142-459(-)